MGSHDVLQMARAAFTRSSWDEAGSLFERAKEMAPLSGADLEHLAAALYLTGDDDRSTETWAQAHRFYVDTDDVPRAVRCAFWLAFEMAHRGQRARASGWLTRAKRMLDVLDLECVERGYLLIPAGMEQIYAGKAHEAYQTFARAEEIAHACDDVDLAALALHSRGRVLIRMGQIDQGMTCLDEAMAVVDAETVSPMVVGDVYCSVIEGCLEVFDVRRAREWTDVLSQWCDAQPDLMPYRGQCLVRRAEIMQLHGEWDAALEEAALASDLLTRPPGEPAAGSAFYRQAEVQRLRGAFADAEALYRRAREWGRSAQPGLALLRLAQGRLDAGEAMIRRAVEESNERSARAMMLSALVEIMLAIGNVEDAKEGAHELAATGADLDASYLRAIILSARGAVELAEGRCLEALDSLRVAAACWRDIGAPYESARIQILIGHACRELGDGDTADIEFDAARAVLQKLGAVPDLSRLDALQRGVERGDRHGLTSREMEVLRLVAAGESNRGIAETLGISERTVERHLSNIFNKLGVSSRTAATAFAYEYQLV